MSTTTEMLRTDYATYCDNKADRLRRALAQQVEALGLTPAPEGTGLDEDRAQEIAQVTRATNEQIRRWEERARVARDRGLFLMRQEDATDTAFTMDEAAMRIFDKCQCPAEGLVTDHL